MVGIRLRTDSTGSAKSAFYKGTIVASSKHSTNKTDEKNSKRQNRGICKERKIPSLPKTFQRGSSGWGLPEMQGEMSSLLPDSLIASSSGYCHPNVSSYGLQEPFPTYTNAQVRGESLAAMSDRSMQSLGESFRDEERAFGSISSLKRIWSLRRDFTSARGAGFFLEEAPSIDDTELNGVSLDLDHSPIASPTKSISSLIEDLDYHSFSHNPPAPSLPSHHSSQIDFGHQYPSYWTHIPHHASTVKQSQHQHDTKRQSNEHDEQNPDTLSRSMFVNYFWNFFNIADWLTVDMIHDDRSLAALLRLILYNPIYPEFTSLQQFSWAVILGIMMGILTAVWKSLIEFSVDLVWKTVPEILLDWGVFTDLDGPFPVYHYMWITPSLFGGVLSYIFASLPKKIPSQNDWIHSLHSRGVQESDTFGLLFLLSTAGMASGLSLGPELPLMLTSGMVGSWLGILCKQSILSARVLNLTAASAAIGGFFGFPMAGALFVLEVPHRTGLQYFEALSPATISSIVAVLTNRLATGNDITGYYKYPFLNDSLPSSIFHDAIFFGLFGGAIGMVYTNVILKLKGFVHDLFHEIKDQTHQQKVEQDLTHITVSTEESSCPFHGVEVTSSMEKDYYPFTRHKQEKMLRLVIAHEPTRAGVTGAIVGIIVGMTCMFIPHVMFWGESQLQNLIDKGNTPLPVFGRGDEPSAGLVALGFCMVDRTSADGAKFGFSLGCSAAIALAKIFVTGLSIGTGIVGGHFWAPLFVGCAASHFLTDSVSILASALGVSISLSAYPCVAVSFFSY